jgi:teichuronic acid exporter
MSSLKKKTIFASIWSISGRFFGVFLEFFTQLLIARILVPADFGLIASITIFVNLGKQISDAGLGQALIQKQGATHIQESSIFYFNIILGFFLTIIIFLSSGFIAEFYNIPELELIVKIVSVYFIINSFSIVQDAILTKKLNFKFKTIVNIASVFFSGIVAVVLAVLGFGVWSLVTQMLLSITLRNILLWFLSKWRPKKVFDFNSIKSLLNYGSKIFISSVLTIVRINIFSIIIGKAYTMSDLGYYSKANQLQNITSKTFTTSLQNVLFPVFSEIKDDTLLLRSALKKAITYLLFIITPLMVFFIVDAEEIIAILLTERWMESAKYLKLLGVIGILFPIQMMNLNALKAVGHASKFMQITLLWDILSILSAIITSSFGIEIMIVGQVIITTLSYLVNVSLNGELYNYPFKNQIKDISPILFINFLLGLFLFYIFKYLDIDNIFASFLIKIILTIVLYGILNYILNKTFFNTLKNEILLIIKKNRSGLSN